MSTSLQPSISIATPIIYRDEWVMKRRDPQPSTRVGLTLSHKAWPARAVQTDFGVAQRGTLGPPVFLVRWFAIDDGRILGETWEAHAELALVAVPGLPVMRDVFADLGRTVVDVVKAAVDAEAVR